MPIEKKIIPLETCYRLLQTGPTLLLATEDKGGNPDVMALAWHTVLSDDPPLIGVVLAADHVSTKNLMATGVCSLNIPERRLARLVMRCGTVSRASVDKVARFHIALDAGQTVQAPTLRGCFASFECRLKDRSMARKYDFLVLEITRGLVDGSIRAPKTLHHVTGRRFRVLGPGLTVRE